MAGVNTLPSTDWRSYEGLSRLITALGGDAEARLVGGAVRDSILGLPVADIDVATIHLPEEVVQRLKAAHIKTIPTGIAHGTITAVASDMVIEVTTLRRDVETDGRRATIAFSQDWMEDAARRDFTINALYAENGTGAVHDYFNGLADLEARKVRFIGEPLERIAEDHLRILRYFRFHGRFGQGEPDADALNACRARANDLMALSRERISSELLKILALAHPVPVVQLMFDNGIFAPILPEVADLIPYVALVAAEDRTGLGRDAIRGLAALIAPDPAVADKLGKRLRLSNLQAKRLALAAARTEADIADPEALAYRVGRQSAVDRLTLLGADAIAIRIADWPVPVLAIRGADILAAGVQSGPEVARILHAVEAQWIATGFPDEAAQRALLAQAISIRSQ